MHLFLVESANAATSFLVDFESVNSSAFANISTSSPSLPMHIRRIQVRCIEVEPESEFVS